MTRSKKKSRRREDQTTQSARAGRRGASGKPAPSGAGGTVPRRIRAKLNDRPVLRFVVIVSVLMGLFYAVYLPEWESDILGAVLPWNLKMHASACGVILKGLGNDITVIGQSVHSPRFSLQIVRGCDALEPAALFLAGIIAFPASFRAKLPGIVLGLFVLESTNVIRIVSLFYIGIHFPKAFEMMHYEVWQALFIVLAITYWAIWAIWASRREPLVRDVPTT